ncbi:hypothetical protein [Streptosporangium sp. NPDC000396]|uniref:hypothetical protein n=1 Tax=Streptosporangium sp. NPDC000396 TaxID=3366185 RepID=UPI0036A425D0
MRIDEYKLSVQPGEGIIGRFPSAVFLLVSEDDANEPDKLMDLFDGPAGPVEDLDDRLEELFSATESDTIAAFAALVETDQRMSLYLHGPVEVVADGPNADFRAWGPGQVPLLRYEVPDAAGSLSVRYTEGPETDRTWASLDFRAGAVPGSGFVLKRLDLAGSAMDLGMDEPAMPEAVTAEPDAPASPGNTAEGRVRPRLQMPSRPRRPFIPPPAPPAPVTQPFERPAPVTHSFDQPPLTQPPPSLPFQTQSSLTQPFQTQPAALPGLQGLPGRQETTAGNGNPRPTYPSRLLARLLVAATAGALWTAGIAPLLSTGFTPLGDVYTMALISLGLLVVLGVVLWDPIYTFAQRSRRGKDWPAGFFLLQAVPEGLLVYGVQSLLLDRFVVSQPTLIIHLATTSLVLGLGLFCLKFLPFARRVLLRSGGHGTGGMAPETPAVPSPSSVTAGEPAQAPLVWGVNCQQGHFNRPDARYCASCGTAMHGLTREPFQAPRPVLGYLVSDDGTAHVLDSDYVVGRVPQTDEKVLGGRARALATADTDPSVGNAHTDVELDQWDVVITDRGHPAGTFLREPESTSWIRLTPQQSFAVQSGTHIRVGGREFVYHALNQR